MDGNEASAFVTQALYDANTILAATSDNTPTARTIGEGEVVGRHTGGAIGGISYANLVSYLGLSDEDIQDKVGAMVTGNTETGISVTYQDADGTLDFVINGSTFDARNITAKTGTAKTLSSSTPSGGSDGDIWYQY